MKENEQPNPYAIADAFDEKCVKVPNNYTPCDSCRYKDFPARRLCLIQFAIDVVTGKATLTDNFTNQKAARERKRA